MPYRTAAKDVSANNIEWNLFKRYFKAQKSCDNNNCFDCWKDEERICKNECSPLSPEGKPNASMYSFIDASGRSWSQYSSSENIYLVDTNGFKEPNKFGRDRWLFTFIGQDKNRSVKGIPVGVGLRINRDVTAPEWSCAYPPCYFKKWLME